MENPSLASITHSAIKLFSLPDIYFQINEIINDPRFTAEDIGKIILKDPALSFRLLKIVNSSFYGFKARVDTISRAVTIVGLEDLQNLILATSVVDTFSKIPCELIDMTGFWMRSVNCGVLAKLLAQKSAVLHSERLFLAGLLHDIGSLVLYEQLPEQSKQVLKAANHDRTLIAELELDSIGFTHADVGGALISKWGLPDSLSTTITCYLQPEKAQTYKLDAYLVFLASRLAVNVGLGFPAEHMLEQLPEHIFSVIPPDFKDLEIIVEQANDEFSQVYELIAPNKKFH